MLAQHRCQLVGKDAQPSAVRADRTERQPQRCVRVGRLAITNGPPRQREALATRFDRCTQGVPLHLRRWQSVALTLDAENQRLKAALRWIPDPEASYVTARVVADAGGVPTALVVYRRGALIETAS